MSDDEILEATARAVARLGPIRFTLADVAKDVGVTPAALLRRFDTKRRLLLALVETSVDDASRRFAAARASAASPTEAIVAALTEGAGALRTREDVANSLAFLQIDLTDPEFRRLTQAYFEAVRKETRALLDEAVAAGELPPTDTGALAHAVEVTYNGSLITWAIRGGGEACDAVRRDLEALLARR